MECYNQTVEHPSVPEDVKDNKLPKNMLDAIVFFDKAIELDPNDINSHICKGLTLSHYQENYDEAIKCFDKGTNKSNSLKKFIKIKSNFLL